MSKGRHHLRSLSTESGAGEDGPSYEYVGPDGERVNAAIRENRTGVAARLGFEESDAALEHNLTRPIVGKNSAQLAQRHVESLGILLNRDEKKMRR